MVNLTLKKHELLFLINLILSLKIENLYNYKTSELIINKLIKQLDDLEIGKVYLQKFYEYYNKFSDFTNKEKKIN